jgi:hypothetical protein
LLSQLSYQVIDARQRRGDRREIRVELGSIGSRPVPSNRLFEKLSRLTFVARGSGPRDERRSHVLVVSKRAVRCIRGSDRLFDRDGRILDSRDHQVACRLDALGLSRGPLGCFGIDDRYRHHASSHGGGERPGHDHSRGVPTHDNLG